MSIRAPLPAAAAEAHLFDGGPPMRLLRLWGRRDPEHRHVWRRSLILIAIGWLPLLLLAFFAYVDGHEDVWHAFLSDASVHARSLIVVPLLVLAEAFCIPQLGGIAQSFRQRGVVPDSQAGRYEAVVRSILRLRDWWVAEAVAVVLAYVAALLIVRYVPSSFLPDWHRGSAEAPLGRSLASWWHALVSLPLLAILLLGWCWRVFLWSRYLWLVSRLELRLIAPHPDGAGGLMFVSYSLRAFTILGMAAGVIVAAVELAHIWAGGPAGPEQLGYVALATVLVVVAVLTAPVLVLVHPLHRCWQQAVIAYGALAQRTGQAMEDKWMRAVPDADTADPLSTGDFSAMTDLYQSAANAYAMRLTPVDLRSLFALAASVALPFGVVALALVPFDKLLQELLGMFL